MKMFVFAKMMVFLFFGTIARLEMPFGGDEGSSYKKSGTTKCRTSHPVRWAASHRKLKFLYRAQIINLNNDRDCK